MLALWTRIGRVDGNYFLMYTYLRENPRHTWRGRSLFPRQNQHIRSVNHLKSKYWNLCHFPGSRFCCSMYSWYGAGLPVPEPSASVLTCLEISVPEFIVATLLLPAFRECNQLRDPELVVSSSNQAGHDLVDGTGWWKGLVHATCS